MKKTATKTIMNKNSKDFYSFKNYSPNKNAVSVTYNGTTYLSKAQCMALEGITRKELEAYLKKESVPEVVQKAEEEIIVRAVEEELVETDERNDDLASLNDIF